MDDEFYETCDRFYRNLLVQHILQHTRRYAEKSGCQQGSQQRIIGTPPKNRRTTWQTFLDSLSALCDHDKGGETTTAIAVECNPQVQDNVTFWIRVNQLKRNSLIATHAKDHLVYLLQKLVGTTRHVESAEPIMLELFHTSVDKAKNRVNNYRKKLQGLITDMEQCEKKKSSEEKLVLKVLRQLINENKNVRGLCRQASIFRTTEEATLLVAQARSDSAGLWKYICHFVGRLGAWYKAAQFVSRHAAAFTDVLSSPSVQIVPYEEPYRSFSPPEVWKLDTLLSRTITPVLHLSEERMDQLFGSGAFTAGSEQLKKCHDKGWRLKEHAEATMARFFYQSNKHFLYRQRYIGCSKPSCVCCELYIELLPGSFERRPCHGNAWTQWRIPSLSSVICDEDILLVQRMTDKLQRDNELDIISASKGHVFTHDSSTNMSSVFARLRLW
ncbi:hypothetical protein LTR86_011005 [Recurvomyces mirabilis]|nr:hypothetical protein LTR86_011005 [Recurvomyces mirabilis]